MTASQLQAWLTNDHVDEWRAATFFPLTNTSPVPFFSLLLFYFRIFKVHEAELLPWVPSQSMGQPKLGRVRHDLGFDPNSDQTSSFPQTWFRFTTLGLSRQMDELRGTGL